MKLSSKKVRDAYPTELSLLKDIRKIAKAAELTVLSAADPLNLTGIITPGDRVASSASQRLVYREGLPMAHGSRSNIHYHQTFDAEHQWQLRWALMGK